MTKLQIRVRFIISIVLGLAIFLSTRNYNIDNSISLLLAQAFCFPIFIGSLLVANLLYKHSRLLEKELILWTVTNFTIAFLQGIKNYKIKASTWGFINPMLFTLFFILIAIVPLFGYYLNKNK